MMGPMLRRRMSRAMLLPAATGAIGLEVTRPPGRNK